MLSAEVSGSGFSRDPSCTKQTGFSLIELMISLVLGLILIGSVLTLVVSIMGSNAETIRATRLTQELRTLVEVIGREAERARFMADPLSNIGNPPDEDDPTVGAKNANGLIDDSAGDCLRFSYAEPDGTSGTNNTAVTFALRDGAIFVGRQRDAPLETWTDPDGNDRERTTLVACDDADVRLSSPEILIEAQDPADPAFVVSVLDDADAIVNEDGTAGTDGWVDCDQPDSILVLELSGKFAAGGGDDFARKVSDRIRIGSTDLKIHPSCY